MPQQNNVVHSIAALLVLVYAVLTTLYFLPIDFLAPLPPAILGLANLSLLLAFLIEYRLYRKTLAREMAQNQENTDKLKTLKRAHQKEKERLSIVLDSGRIAYWEWNIKQNTAYFSDLWQEMIGFDQHDFPQDLHAWQARIHPQDQQSVQKKLLKLLSNQETEYEDTHRLMNADGNYVWVYDRGQAIFSEQGEIEKLSCVRLDVTESKQIEETLTLDRILLDSTKEAIAITDGHLNFIRTNPAFHRAFGFTQEELGGLSLKTLLDNLQDDPPIDILKEVEAKGEWRGELILHHLDGSLARASLVDIQKIFYETTENIHYALVYTDITELKATQKELSHLANTDIVTGLPNRNYFYTALEHYLQDAAEQGEKFTLMFLDLDNFKTINDTLGHDIGDKLLQSVSQLISEQVAQDTIIARVGGDEFVILCRTYTTEEQLKQVGQQLNVLLQKPFKLGAHQVQIGSSIGMAIYPDHGASQSELLQNADAAMYEAKKAGKGQHRIYSVASN